MSEIWGPFEEHRRKWTLIAELEAALVGMCPRIDWRVDEPGDWLGSPYPYDHNVDIKAMARPYGRRVTVRHTEPWKSLAAGGEGLWKSLAVRMTEQIAYHVYWGPE